MIYQLGISAYYHDAAAALIADGEIIAAAQEERFTRLKNDPAFPVHAIRYCLAEAGITLADLDSVIFYEKPFTKFERLLQTYYDTAPSAIRSFLKAMPVWLQGKLFMKKKIREELLLIGTFDKTKLPVLFTEHHLAHAASAFFPSGFADAAILTIDGVGEWATCTISHGSGNKITVLRQLNFPHSVGLLYSSFTYFCGFKVNQDEYKLMGLAAYGVKSSEEYHKFVSIIENKLVTIAADGSIELNQEFFSYTSALRMVKDQQWASLFGIPKREGTQALNQSHCNLALAIQHVTEKIVLKLAAEAKRLTGSDYLCMAGGVALNGVANGKLVAARLFRQVFIQPASNDAGGALGAALAAWHIQRDGARLQLAGDGMKGSLLGPSYTDEDVLKAAPRTGILGERLNDAEFFERISSLLSQGKVIAWHQGRMEFGPRALGNRSILGDPRSELLQKELNEKVKFRESFRPFAPIILEEEVNNYFDLAQPSPYMLIVQQFREQFRMAYPDGADNWDLTKKLRFKRSFVPAVTHIDFTARIQSVNGSVNPRLHTLLTRFFADTGCPMLVNTSFNMNNEPIVNSPADAFRCFMATNIDYLAINNFIYQKTGDA